MTDEIKSEEVTTLPAQGKFKLLNKLIDDSQTILKSGWRPALMWAFLAICINDFIVLPYIIMTYTGKLDGYVPLTNHNGTGLFYLTFMAIGGVTAWTRGSEKNALIDAVSGGK